MPHSRRQVLAWCDGSSLGNETKLVQRHFATSGPKLIMARMFYPSPLRGTDLWLFGCERYCVMTEKCEFISFRAFLSLILSFISLINELRIGTCGHIGITFHFVGSLWCYCGVDLESLWGHFEVTSGSLWVYFGVTFGRLWDHLGVIN